MGEAARLFRLEMGAGAAFGNPDDGLLCVHCHGLGCLRCAGSGIDGSAYLTPAARRAKALADSIRCAW
jgi:hypothetical protein